ncbi:MAG: lasso peptide biosynthesis B2 protein [Pseudomonadota bacterium]
MSNPSASTSIKAKTTTLSRAKKLALKAEIWLRARFLPLQIRNHALGEVLALADAKPASRLQGTDWELICKYAWRLTRNPLLMRNRQCLRTGVLGYAMLRRAGYEPQLWFGIDNASLNEPAIEAHCWVVLDGDSVIDQKNENMTVIHVHPAGEQTYD